MNKTGDTKKAETAVRTDKYPHSDNDWENFDVLHINRLPSAATFMAYTTKEKAVKNDKSQSEYFQSLNGTWKFQFVPRSDQRPMDFFEKGHARVSQVVGQKENPSNFLLMHAMGPNVAGVIGSAIAAGILLSYL